jgi:hypothetical protein
VGVVAHQSQAVDLGDFADARRDAVAQRSAWLRAITTRMPY